MKLLVGLGNPGRRYADTRHNAGFCVADRFAERCGIAFTRQVFSGEFGRGRACGIDVGILKPMTFMNLAGRAVAEALQFLPVANVENDIVVIFDDVDLPFGRLRVRKSGGAGGHQGVADVIARIGRSDFPRLRFGVGRPPAGQDTADYVLERFDTEERERLPALFDTAAEALELLLREGVDVAMNRFNAECE